MLTSNPQLRRDSNEFQMPATNQVQTLPLPTTILTRKNTQQLEQIQTPHQSTSEKPETKHRNAISSTDIAPELATAPYHSIPQTSSKNIITQPQVDQTGNQYHSNHHRLPQTRTPALRSPATPNAETLPSSDLRKEHAAIKIDPNQRTDNETTRI